MRWIDRLERASDGFTRAAVVDGSDAEPLDHGHVGAMLRGLASAESREHHARAFCRGQRCYASEAAVFAGPPAPGQSLDSWARASFEGDEHTLVVYRAEQFDDGFATAVARRFAALQRRRGVNPAGQECFVFMGRYLQTPFGIHQDRDQGLTLHFHLGPGRKRMYSWDPERYRELSAAETSFARLAEAAEVHELSAGSIYLLPPNVYHVGESVDFSIGVAVSEVRSTRRRLLQQALAGALDRLDSQELDAEIAHGSSLAAVQLGLELEGSATTWIADALADQARRLHSNLGFTSPPLARTPPTLENHTLLRTHPVFPLTWVAEPEGELVIYCRGDRLRLPYSAALDGLLAQLTATAVSLAAALRCLAADFEPEAALWLVHELASRRAIVTEEAP